jgi:dipeptidyl aminopeptidase/acylaminoacyl peptidase
MKSAGYLARLVALCSALATIMFAQTPSGYPPVEAFGTLPEVSEPSLSPDGKHLATINVYQGRPIAVIHTLEPTGVKPVGLPYAEGFIVGVKWANNDRLLITVNLNKRVWGDNMNPWFRTVSVDSKGQNGVTLFSNKGDTRNMNYSASEISDLAPEDPDHVYMPLFDDPFGNAPRFTMFRVDVTTGSAERVVSGGLDTQDMIMDGHGHVVARIDESKRPLTDHLMLYGADGNWNEVEKQDATGGNGLGVAGLSEDGTALIMTSTDDKTGMLGLVVHNLSDGKEKDLFSDPHYDIGAVLTDPWTGRVVGVSVTADRENDTYFDAKLQAMQQALSARFPGASVHAVDWDLARQKIIVAVDGPRTPSTYYMLDQTTNSVLLLVQTYQHLQERDLGEVKTYPYTARDGLVVPAYLTLPPGKTPKNLPVVIFPHGGPMARDEMQFDWMAQFMANRGYAVLQPNFRGSSGYGKKYEQAGYGQWGLKMQDDITDGVRKLIADGIADPKRICIVGASYGGYAALAGAAFTPDLYACAAGWAGVYDLRHFLSTRAEDYGRDSTMISSWSKFIGDRWDDSDKLDAASPSENASKIKCPVLLMHGAADATVRIDQSEEMDRALRHADKKVTFIKIDDETHYMQASSTRIRVLTELEKFLKENIGN